MQVKFAAIFIIFGIFSLSAAHGADFSLYDFGKEAGILLKGEIVPGDNRALLATIKDANSQGKSISQIVLYSVGGDVAEAIAMGRTIRKYRIYAWGPVSLGDPDPLNQVCYFEPGSLIVQSSDPNCICASACALAWFGGVKRFGVIGVHRSFLPNVSRTLSYSEQEKILSVSRSEITLYLSEMGAPMKTIDEVLTTRSQDISFLDSILIPEIGMDPVWEEYIISWCGKDYFSPEDLIEFIRLSARDITGSLNKQEKTDLAKLTQRKVLGSTCENEAHVTARQEAQPVSSKP